jgi:hypothetical protein
MPGRLGPSQVITTQELIAVGREGARDNQSVRPPCQALSAAPFITDHLLQSRKMGGPGPRPWPPRSSLPLWTTCHLLKESIHCAATPHGATLLLRDMQRYCHMTEVSAWSGSSVLRGSRMDLSRSAHEKGDSYGLPWNSTTAPWPPLAITR